MRTSVSAPLLLLIPSLCIAQIETIEVSAECLVGSAVATAPPMIGASFGTQLAQTRTCLDNGDSDCAEGVIDEIDADALNDDERAILALLRGDQEALDGSSRRARREYRSVLDGSGTNRQIVRAAVGRLATLYVDDGDPEDALEQLEALDCGDWSPDLLVLQARAQFGLRDFAAAQTSVQSAIDFQQGLGADVPEDWILFKAANLRAAVTAEEEEIICTNTTLPNSLIPREVCTTRAQREWEAEQSREWARTGGEQGGIIEVR